MNPVLQTIRIYLGKLDSGRLGVKSIRTEWSDGESFESDWREWNDKAKPDLLHRVFSALKNPSAGEFRLDEEDVTRLHNLLAASRQPSHWTRRCMGAYVDDRGRRLCRLSLLFEVKRGGAIVKDGALAENAVWIRSGDKPQERVEISDELLVDAGLAMLRRVTKKLLRKPRRDDEFVHAHQASGDLGNIVKGIDLVSADEAEETLQQWRREKCASIAISGEDVLDPQQAIRDFVEEHGKYPQAVCHADWLDGTLLWEAGRNLFGSALSFCARNDAGEYELRVSMICLLEVLPQTHWVVLIAREDEQQAYIQQLDGDIALPLKVAEDKRVSMETARVLTVARQPHHWKAMARIILENDVPMGTLFGFGGVPGLGLLATGVCDAVVQPDASEFGPTQKSWDYLAGLHVGTLSGCAIRHTDGSPIDVAQIARATMQGEEVHCPYIATRHPHLVDGLLDWVSLHAGVGG